MDGPSAQASQPQFHTLVSTARPGHSFIPAWLIFGSARSLIEMPITLCDITFPREWHHTCLPTPDGDPKTDQSVDPKNFQFGESMSCIGIALQKYGLMVTEAEMTQKLTPT